MCIRDRGAAQPRRSPLRARRGGPGAPATCRRPATADRPAPGAGRRGRGPGGHRRLRDRHSDGRRARGGAGWGGGLPGRNRAHALPVPADQRRQSRWSGQSDRPWGRGHVVAGLRGGVRGRDVGRLRVALVARRGGGRGRRSRLRVRRPPVVARLPARPGRPRGGRLAAGASRARRAPVPGARCAAGRQLMAELDPLIHAPARLQVVTTLSAVSEAEFAALRAALEVSDSVLSKHVSALADAGYVRSRKGVRAGRRTTWTVSYTHLRAHETVLDLV